MGHIRHYENITVIGLPRHAISVIIIVLMVNTPRHVGGCWLAGGYGTVIGIGIALVGWLLVGHGWRRCYATSLAANTLLAAIGHYRCYAILPLRPLVIAKVNNNNHVITMVNGHGHCYNTRLAPLPRSLVSSH